MDSIEVPAPSALRLADALWRARGEHVVRLRDVEGGLDPSHGVIRLILDAGSVPLAEVLARDLGLGEAVAILVPLARCVEGLAAARVVHGGISIAAVRLDERGAPVLGGFETARVIDAHEENAMEQATWRADRVAFCELARDVLLAVADARAARDALNAGLATAGDERGSLAAFAERLLAAAAPEPVRLGLPPAARAPADDAGEATGRAPRSDLLTRLRARVGRIRPRFWAPALLAVAGLAVALAVTPGDGVPPLEDSRTTPSPGPTLASPESGLRTITAQDPVAAVLALRRDARTATLVDDYGDVVLLRVETAAGTEDILVERGEDGWRLRETQVDAD